MTTDAPALSPHDGDIKNRRQRLKLEDLRSGDVAGDSLTLWYDSRGVNADAAEEVVHRISRLRYTGVVLYPENLDRLSPLLASLPQQVVHIETVAELEELAQHPLLQGGAIVCSPSSEVLDKAEACGATTCLRAYVDDAPGLHHAIEHGRRHAYLMIRFRDPTNIPLELVIASLQATNTVLIKEINSASDVEDALVSLGVMEVGADGVMFSPRDHECLDAFIRGLDPIVSPQLTIEPATIVRSVPAGMGYRSCIDLAALFSETEGMLVGSTSQGGILCCPEVFFLPYMELRPFRVNAGAVHSYVYNANDRTDYMSELRAGSPVMVVGIDGRTRRATVGRMKTEVRPLRLIEAEFSGGHRVNILMQDDWHVRIFSAEGKPLNVTELEPGTKVLGHPTQAGRHVGIKIEEHIIEV